MAQMINNLPAVAGDVGLIPGSGRSLGEGNGNSLQYSCLENSMDRGTWRVTVHGVSESDTTEWLTLPLLLLKRVNTTFHVHYPKGQI